MHVAQQVGGGVRVHLLHNVGSAIGVERAHNRHLHLGGDLLQGLSRDSVLQRLEDGFPLRRSQIFHDVGNVGAVHQDAALIRADEAEHQHEPDRREEGPRDMRAHAEGACAPVHAQPP